MSARRAPAWSRALGVRPADLRVLGWVGAVAFLMGAAGDLAWLSMTGRFLQRVGHQELPWVYVALNGITMALFLARAARGRTARSRHGLGICLALFVAATYALGIFRVTRHRGITAAAFVAAWLFTIVADQEYWAWVAALVPVRVAKRLTPPAGGCMTAGRLVGAVLVMDPFGWYSISNNLVLAGVLALLAVPGLLRAEAAARAHPEAAAAEEPGEGDSQERPIHRPPAGLGETFAFVRHHPLLRRVVVIAFMTGILMGTADYPLAVTAAQRFPDEETLAAFFGAFGAASNLLSVLLQFLASGALLQRLPLSLQLAIFPGALGLGALAGMAAPGFLVAASIRFLQRTLTRIVHTPACMVLFTPLPSRYSIGARALGYSVAIAAGFTVSGLGMIAVRAGDPPLEAVYAVMALAGGAACLAARGADRRYVEALLATTGKDRTAETRRELRRVAEVALGNPATAAVLLAREDDAVAAAIVEALRGSEAPGVEEVAAALLDAGSWVALEALERLARAHLPGPLATRLGEALLGDPSSRVARRVARALGSLGDAALAPALRRRLEGSAGKARARIASALLRVARRDDDVRAGVRALRQELRSEDGLQRAAAVAAVGGLGMQTFVDTLTGFLEDPEPAVQLEAALALGRARHAGGLPSVERALHRARDPGVRRALRGASQRIQDETLESICDLLDSLSTRERKRLAQAMGGLEGAQEGYVAALAIEDPRVRAAVVQGLRAGEGAYALALEETLAASPPGAGAMQDAGPLLAFIGRARPEPVHPVFGLLARAWRDAWLDPVVALVDELVCEVRAEEEYSPGDERLRLACVLAGVIARDPEGYRRAFDRVEGADARAASEAIELLQAGVPDRRVGRRLARLLEELRRATLEPAA